MVKKNTCVFISGKGSNLKKIILSSRSYVFPINIKLIVSNNKNAAGLKIARKFAIPYIVISNKTSCSEEKILKELKKYKITILLLAGYMRILSKKFIKNFGNIILNIHPSLLPKFKGLDTFKRVLESKEKKTGCTVHFVTEKLDDGKVVLKKFFYINDKDDFHSIKKKTQQLEHRAFSEAIIKVIR